jgi:hypothetical protein
VTILANPTSRSTVRTISGRQLPYEARILSSAEIQKEFRFAGRRGMQKLQQFNGAREEAKRYGASVEVVQGQRGISVMVHCNVPTPDNTLDQNLEYHISAKGFKLTFNSKPVVTDDPNEQYAPRHWLNPAGQPVFYCVRATDRSYDITETPQISTFERAERTASEFVALLRSLEPFMSALELAPPAPEADVVPITAARGSRPPPPLTADTGTTA